MMTKLAIDTLVLRKLEPGPDTVSSLARILQTEPERVKAALYRLVRAQLVEESGETDPWRTLDRLRAQDDGERRFYHLTGRGQRFPDDAVRRKYHDCGGRFEAEPGGALTWTGIALPGDLGTPP